MKNLSSKKTVIVITLALLVIMLLGLAYQLIWRNNENKQYATEQAHERLVEVFNNTVASKSQNQVDNIDFGRSECYPPGYENKLNITCYSLVASYSLPESAENEFSQALASNKSIEFANQVQDNYLQGELEVNGHTYQIALTIENNLQILRVMEIT